MSKTPKVPVVLLADDDADDQLLAQDALSEAGFSVDLRFVNDGVELMDYLHCRGRFVSPASAPRPSLILLDLNMPRKDGREALQDIKLDPNLRRIPVVILTTSNSDIDIYRVYSLGANSFITKPVAFNLLVQVMKTLGDYWFGVVALPPRS